MITNQEMRQRDAAARYYRATLNHDSALAELERVKAELEEAKAELGVAAADFVGAARIDATMFHPGRYLLGSHIVTNSGGIASCEEITRLVS